MTAHTTSLGLCALAAVSLTAPAASQRSWPHFRGPNYDGVPLAKAFTARSAKEIWRASVHTGFSSMSIVDGRLYTMGNRDKNTDVVTCLSASDGKGLWTFDYPCPLAPKSYEGGPSATPTVHQGKVYTLSKFGHAFCLDAKTGEKLWEASAARLTPRGAWWGFAGSPTVLGGTVYLNIGDKGLALHKDTGKVVWSSERAAVAYSTIIPLPESMLGRSAIAVLTNETLHVLDPATGGPLAALDRPLGGRANNNGVTPMVYDGSLFVTHASHGMSRLTLEGTTFRQAWQQRAAAMNWFTFNQHIYHKGRIYFLRRPRGLHCIEAKSGQVKWREDQYRFGNLLRVGDTLILLSERGELIWGPLADGRFRETFRARVLDGRCWAYPVLHDGHFYARNSRGTLVCLKLE